MSFKMRAEVDDWFRHIFKQGPIQTKFDLYYFCLMMGLAEGKSEPATNAVEFVTYFVGDYKQAQRLVLGLLVLAEIARLEEGFARLNDYANAGFTTITEALAGARPYQVETFVQWYAKELSKRIEANPTWKAYLS